MPFSNPDTARRRRVIYRCFHLGLTRHATDQALAREQEKPISDSDFQVWESLLYPIASSDLLMKRAIVEEGRSLAWVAEKINLRRQDQIIS